MKPPTTAYIALGANLGDRLTTFREALSDLEAAGDVRVTAISPLYETAPVGGPSGQMPFYNAAAALTTTRDPLDLLTLMQSVEAKHKRTRDIVWGPRTLDLDLLFFSDHLMDGERLIVPHPRLHERRFVLAPLAAIAAERIHPTLKMTVAELLAALPADDVDDVVAVAENWR